MPIAANEIEKGAIYRTQNKPDRLVLGWDRDGRVVYTSRGKDKERPFQNCHVRLTPQRFADAVLSKIGDMPDLREYIVANKATTVVVR